jgi:glycosyltransferase involved in cell wall biosynthesis
MPTIFYEIQHPLAVKKKSGIPRCIEKISKYLHLVIDSNWSLSEVIGLNKYNDFIYAEPYIQRDEVLGIIPKKGDIFISVFCNIFMNNFLISKLDAYKKNGVSINFIVHDIMPITNPEFFIGKLSYSTPEQPQDIKIHIDSFSNLSKKNSHLSFKNIFANWLLNVVTISNSIFCPSITIISDIKKYLLERNISYTTKFVLLPWGFDKNDLKESKNLPLNFKNIFQESKDLIFLMVGSIETRKSHKFILDCFDKVWSHGENFRLIWAGSDAWVDEDFILRYKNHPLLNTNLFLLGALSDEELRYCYEHANALISASLKEGFGLPNIEAAVYGLPIIARDIPVFREICADNAYYFPDCNNVDDFISHLNKWIILRNNDLEPKSKNIKVLKWDDVAKSLLKHI